MNADPGGGEAGGWPRWAAAVREALARRSLSVNAAAEQLGVRNTTLGRWLDAAAPPQLSLLPRIAELTGLTHAIQLELGGVLPPAMRAEAHAIQVTSELSSAVDTIAEVVARAGELAFSDAGARLAGILLSHEGADGAATRKHVWSVADHRVLPAVASHLAEADVACAVYVRSGDRLLARGAEIWNVPLAEMVQLRAALDDLTETAPWSVLTLSLPDELLASDPGEPAETAGDPDAGEGIDGDRLADVAMLAAVDAWRHMHSYGFVPSAAAAGGRLRSMFDRHGRPEGDLRRSLVTGARRMPPRRA